MEGTEAYLIEVEDEVQLANVLKSPVQGFNEYLWNAFESS